MTGKTQYLFLTLIVALYWIVGGLFAIRTPDWQVSDEPAHYNYIKQLTEQGCCPMIEMGDWDTPYLEEIKAARFAPETLDRFDTIEYEDHQPPLYYLLATPIYMVTNGSLTTLRLFSVLVGTIIVVCAFGVGKVMFPARPEIGLGAAAFVAFVPQHLAFLAAVNNDSLGWGLVALILLASIAYVKRVERVKPWVLGLLVGVALLTKTTAYMMAGIALLAVVLRWWSEGTRRPADLARVAALYLVPALILGGLWWGRNLAVYGFPDFLGLQAHDEVVVGQIRTQEYIDANGVDGYWSKAIEDTFNSFWGQFGWMGLPLISPETSWVYPTMLALLIFGGIGLLIDRFRQAVNVSMEQRNAWLLLALTIVLAVLVYVYYNTEFLQLQGRYMYPLLIPLGILLALGVDGWRWLLLRRWAWSRWLTPLFFLVFVPIDVWLLWRVIVPNLTPSV